MNYALANVPGDDPPLEWCEEFSVGVAQLDEDHRLLFELVRTIEELPRPLPAERVTGLLDALATYVATHFAREEEHQAAIGFPGLARHRELHRQLIARLESFRRQHASDPRRFDIAALRDFMRRWLINHVLNEDMSYRWFEEGNYPDV